LLAFELALVAATLLLLRIPAQPQPPRGAGLGAAVACYALATAAAIAAERLTVGVHWLHAPLRALVAEALVLAGTLVLATRGLARIAPWRGARRYLALAVAIPLVIGVVLLVLGAAELAWIWLLPAAIAAALPRIGVVAQLLPAALVLAPSQLREAAWNGFLPAQLPLATWLAVLGAPFVLQLAWLIRQPRRTGPLGSLVLPLGSGLAVLAGVITLAVYRSPCNSHDFERLSIACEVTRPWH
jgi:hypothetical protein